MHAIALHQVPDVEHVDLPIDRLIRIARHDFHSQHSLATTITADTSCPPFVQVTHCPINRYLRTTLYRVTQTHYLGMPSNLF